jgi:hypothetical protein
VGEPCVLVPASLLERFTLEQWDTLLAHELAHLRRGDPWVRMLELAALALYWWHPVVWWARRELREAEEQCCDAWVVWALPGAAEMYATTLVVAVTYLSGARSALPVAASGVGQKHLLKRRLTMIMRGTTPRGLSAAGSFAVLALAAILLPLHPTWARTAQGPQDAGGQQPPGGTAATAGRFSGPADGDVNNGAPAGLIAGDDASLDRGRMEGRRVEDAQDDVDLLRAQLELRVAERREAEALLHQARTDAERVRRNDKNGAVSREQVERANTELQVQQARLAAKDAQIKEAELRLKQAERRLARLRGTAKSPPSPDDRPGGSPIPAAPNALRGPAGPAIGATASAPGMPGAAGGFMAPGPHATSTAGGPGMMSGGPGRGFGFGPGAGLGGSGSGFAGGGGFSGGARFGAVSGTPGGPGVPYGIGPDSSRESTYEHRLAEVEKKLQNLIDEMKTLRKELRPAKPKPSNP